MQLIKEWIPGVYYAGLEVLPKAAPALGGTYTVSQVVQDSDYKAVLLAEDPYGYYWPETAICRVFPYEPPPQLQPFGDAAIQSLLGGVAPEDTERNNGLEKNSVKFTGEFPIAHGSFGATSREEAIRNLLGPEAMRRLWGIPEDGDK